MKNNPLEQRSGCSAASASVVPQCFCSVTQGSSAIQKIPDTLRRLGRLCPFAGSLPLGRRVCGDSWEKAAGLDADLPDGTRPLFPKPQQININGAAKSSLLQTDSWKPVCGSSCGFYLLVELSMSLPQQEHTRSPPNPSARNTPHVVLRLL